MTGETDLQRLLRGMAPELAGCDWGYALAQTLPAGLTPFATVAEDEGLTLIAPMVELQAAGLSPLGPMARITLTIHSSLAAVGLTAAVSQALAAKGISANMIAGFHHDHIFLPAERAEEAMAALWALTHD
jgi:hypothetical protein